MANAEREAYNDRIENFRRREYPMLKDGEVYLDHAGTTLYAASLMERFAADMTAGLYGNPHSASASSQLSMSRIEDIRVRVLRDFRADPSKFDVVFVANATAGIKLVMEAFRCAPDGFCYAYHLASHTSLVGVREEAVASICLDDDAVESWLSGDAHPGLFKSKSASPLKLFAYPAQSNMDGRRFPLKWAQSLRARESSGGRLYTLLDAASLVATSPLDLSDSESAPDFTVLSFNKMFGFPDLGALIVRRDAAPVFHNRRYFGGGTVDMVVCAEEQWHASKSTSLPGRVEDGTLPIHSIIALDSALDVHQQLFGPMADVSAHTSFLARRLYDGLAQLRHGNNTNVCVIYGPRPVDQGDMEGDMEVGPVVALNIRDENDAWLSLTEFEKLAALKGFHIRTGGLCNPGGIATALGLEPWEMKQNFSAGYRCGNEQEIVSGKPTGVIRLSVGAMSTISDVDKFVAFVGEFYTAKETHKCRNSARTALNDEQSGLHVRNLTVYPIKSCGGYRVPSGMLWEVRREGLAWDREWCLVHQGSGQALSQKRYPKMALIHPAIDTSRGVLRISYRGHLARDRGPIQITVPLSANPAFHAGLRFQKLASRVCGEEVSAQIYTSSTVNDFFSSIIGVPCALARFPPGGLGQSMRHAKAHLQRHQDTFSEPGHNPAGRYPRLFTPPDSDNERDQPRILLSNESPLLVIHQSSLEQLDKDIVDRGGRPVAAEVFRANIVVGALSTEQALTPYSEDHWSGLRIGRQNFTMMGSCRRCHMVCIDQATATKSQEPFTTLTKTRRFDGRVFFGIHMCHAPSNDDSESPETHCTAMVAVGDPVYVTS